FNACFLLFHFNFGSSTHFDYRNTASQFSYALLQFFAVVIRRSFFDLYTNLLYTRFDLVSVTSTINNSGVVFVHGYALGGTQVLNSSAFQIQTNLFRDHSTAGQYSDILQHSFTTIAEARRFNRSHFYDTADVVYYQSSQRFAFYVFSDDYQWFA